MEELNTPVFAQAKIEYTAQLIDLLYSHMFDGVKSIYEESKVISLSRSGMPILLIFRELLEKVPIWNSEIIDSECSRIINNTQCDWIDDLITAVFISHTKILTSIGPNQSFQKINVTIPKTSTFIHKSYINTAREIWKNPYLFNENVPGHEFQKNNKEIEYIIKKCIENTIRNLLPIKEILREHLEGETDSILNQKETLKQLLREELKNIGINHGSSDMSDDDGTCSSIDDTDYQDKSLRDKDVRDALPDALPEASPKITPKITPDGNLPTIINENDNDSLNNLFDELKGIVGQQTGGRTDLPGDVTDLPGDVTTDLPGDVTADLPGDVTADVTADLPTAHGDPSAAQVAKQCSEIIVNDITIPVEIPMGNVSSSSVPTIPTIPTIPVEIKYDNVNLTDDNVNVDHNRIKRLMTNMEVTEDINVIKSSEIGRSVNDIPVNDIAVNSNPFSLNNLYKDINPPPTIPTSVTTPTIPTSVTTPTLAVTEKIVSPLQIITENTVVIPNEPKSPRKDMVVVTNDDDIDDTSSLANFFVDMKKIVEDKGIIVENNNDKSFSLFEDASEVDK